MTTINELIAKYEEKINEINEIIFWSSLRNEMISKYEKKICEEILKDLEKLKEKISAKTSKCKDGTMNDAYIFYLEKEIIGE